MQTADAINTSGHKQVTEFRMGPLHDEAYQANILIVDDTPMNLKLLSDMLSRYGYRVRAVRDGEMALRSVQSSPPDLILLDIRMPGMDGYEVCTTLKTDPQNGDIPVVFISALNDSDDIVRGFEVGGADYVTKPFKFREVLARVENQLTLVRQKQEIEETRKRERQYYETLNNMKDRFISAATHDMKNPVALIIGYATLLENSPTALSNPEILDFVEGIQKGSNKLLRLITEMLDLIQIESGYFLTLEPTDLQALIGTTIESYRLLASEKQITLQYESDDVQTIARIDASKFERVLDNLISNAVKYTANGGQVAVRKLDERTQVVIEIEDSGYGIPKDALKRIFEPFYRVGDEMHQEQEGTGLGLAVTKTIIDQHQGELYVESQVGQGSIFTIVLPKTPTDDNYRVD
jgi:signal transduction histidine kinase